MKLERDLSNNKHDKYTEKRQIVTEIVSNDKTDSLVALGFHIRFNFTSKHV